MQTSPICGLAGRGAPGHLPLSTLLGAIFACGLGAQSLGLQPYGAATIGPSGHRAEAWTAGSAWIGNGAFAITLDRAAPGRAAVVGLSLAPADRPQFGIRLLIDLAPGRFLGTAVVATDNSGAASLGLPLPPLPGLLGATLHAQWLVVENGGLGASDGVRARVQAGGWIAVSSLVNQGDLMLVEPSTHQVVHHPAVPCRQLQFTPDGDRLVADPLRLFDATSLPLQGPLQVAVGNGLVREYFAVHPDGRSAYVLHQGLSRVDIDPGSPTFATIVAQVPGFAAAMAGDPAGLAISGDGRRLVAITSEQCLPLGACWGRRSMQVVDVDPASPARDTLLAGYAVNGPGRFFRDVEIAHDGSHAYVLDHDANLRIWHYRLADGHRVGQLGLNGYVALEMVRDARGRHLLVPNLGQGTYDVVDLGQAGALLGFRSHQPGPGSFVATLSPDGSIFYCSANGVLVGCSAATGQVVWSGPAVHSVQSMATR